MKNLAEDLTEAAQRCPTCNDIGIVGNVFNAEPCPDCCGSGKPQPTPAMAGDRNEQIIAAMTLIKQDYGPESARTTRPREYVHNAVIQLIDAGYQRAQSASGEDATDAARLQAMAAEWDRARRGVDSYMPIWDALCEAIGDNADGNGMRAAIDSVMQQGGQP